MVILRKISYMYFKWKTESSSVIYHKIDWLLYLFCSLSSHYRGNTCAPVRVGLVPAPHKHLEATPSLHSIQSCPNPPVAITSLERLTIVRDALEFPRQILYRGDHHIGLNLLLFGGHRITEQCTLPSHFLCACIVQLSCGIHCTHSSLFLFTIDACMHMSMLCHLALECSCLVSLPHSFISINTLHTILSLIITLYCPISVL